jgi:hypothetical protein
LHFDENQTVSAGVFHAVSTANRNVDRLARADCDLAASIRLTLKLGASSNTV